MSVLERKLPSLAETRLHWDIVNSGVLALANAELSSMLKALRGRNLPLPTRSR